MTADSSGHVLIGVWPHPLPKVRGGKGLRSNFDRRNVNST